MPSFTEIQQQVNRLKFENPGKSPQELSRLFINKARNKYSSVGAVTALPGVIPGLGTVTQIVFEAGAISADVALMLRYMAGICYGTGLLYGYDIKDDFEGEFTLVLGIWAEVLIPEKAALATGEKITIGHFDKHITGRIRNRMNQKIARKLVVKYGSKRGGTALGRLIPFGVGAVVGGTFNYITLQKFGKAAENYFRITNTDYILPE